MSELLLLGTSHKTASLELRERIAVTDTGAERLLAELPGSRRSRRRSSSPPAIARSSTSSPRDPVEAETAVVGKLARRAGLRPTELLEGVYSHRNCDAARHLYRVVSGLESMIVGEAEVQGQVKRAYELALARPHDRPADQQALPRRAGDRQARAHRDGIGAGRATVASVAVERRATRWATSRGRHVLIVGAGETAELTAQALHEHGVVDAVRRQPPARPARSRWPQRFGGATVSFDELPAELERADIVVASTSSPHALIEAEELADVVAARDGRPLLLIDLAVPRDIEPACAELPGVTLADIDALQAQVARHHLVRRAEARRAEGIVEEEIQAFAGWLGTLEVLPTIAALRAQADALVDQLLAENAGRWETPRRARPRARRGDRARRRQAAAARADAAREGARRRAPPRAPAVLRELFGLEEAPARRREPAGRRGPPAARAVEPLRIGTRGSALALAQARWVAARLPASRSSS